MSYGFGAYNTGPENSLHLIFWVEMFVFNAEDFPQGKIIFLLDVVLLPTRLSNVLFNPLDSLLDVILVNVILTRSNCQLLPTFLLPLPLLLLSVGGGRGGRLELTLHVVVLLHLGLGTTLVQLKLEIIRSQSHPTDRLYQQKCIEI